MELNSKAILFFNQNNIDISNITAKEIDYINKAMVIIDQLNKDFEQKKMELDAIKININTVAEGLNISTKTISRYNYLRELINGCKKNIKYDELHVAKLREKINSLEREIEFYVHNYYQEKKEEKIIQQYIRENERLKNEVNELKKLLKN